MTLRPAHNRRDQETTQTTTQIEQTTQKATALLIKIRTGARTSAIQRIKASIGSTLEFFTSPSSVLPSIRLTDQPRQPRENEVYSPLRPDPKTTIDKETMTTAPNDLSTFDNQ